MSPVETMNSRISPGELIDTVESVFTTMMDLEVERTNAPWSPATGRVSAAVHLKGACSGTVLLECAEAQARRFAARFLSMDPPADDLVSDVLGELINMIGGNLKCLLASGVQLSMPSVAIGGDYGLHACRGENSACLSFDCAEGPFWVALLPSEM
jgi:chemotaxis protein CheX